MATVQGFTALDMVNNLSLFGGTITNATASTITVQTPENSQLFYSGYFAYSSGGQLVGGTLTAMTEYAQAQQLWQVIGLSISYDDYYTFYNQSNSAGFVSFALAGDDDVSGSGSADVLAGHLGEDTIDAGSGNDVVYGGRSIADSLDTADRIYGGLGSDTIYGNYGNDTINGADTSLNSLDGADMIYGGRGSDVIFGDAGNDSLYGGGGIAHPADETDTLFGEDGNDYILGNGGDDWLYGDGGNDTIYGGLGADYIVFSHNSGIDMVAGVDASDYAVITRNINGTNIIDFASLMTHVTATSYGTYFDFGNGNGVQVYGVALASFTAQDFVFVTG